MNIKSEHTFHIPVMGLAYTIDSPIKVARFGINSVISIIEDRLIELMRKHYYAEYNLPYEPIKVNEPDYRARRITDYLNLVNSIVQKQMHTMRSENFQFGSDIVKYFEMLPVESRSSKLYQEMINTINCGERLERQKFLKTQIVAGSIDVNIMTKIDREVKDKRGNVIVDNSDAVSALRGYIKSDLCNSSVVFSAGINPRLYNYLECSNAFDPNENFSFVKKIIIKVSDYRSALIQGKLLAKKGIWVSEFRIESGLNCGGHAFATNGYLLGPILQEFKNKRQELSESIFDIYKIAVNTKLGFNFTTYPEIEISVQGGIGTHSEDSFLRGNYNISSTGWGTPFLLVPEATSVDAHTLDLLAKAGEEDVILSDVSPLGVRFYYLRDTTSDVEKKQRIGLGKPGSPCTEKYLRFNTEFTKEPICTASYKFQKLKLKKLITLNLPDSELNKEVDAVLAKECLCVGLSNSAALKYNETFLENLKSVNICPGPNIANFTEVVTLKTMADHIYGKINIIKNTKRPHVFIAEMKMYFSYLKEELVNGDMNDSKRKIYYQTFIENLFNAIEYYQGLKESSIVNFLSFKEALQAAILDLNSIRENYSLN
jgi:hypothetical protein